MAPAAIENEGFALVPGILSEIERRSLFTTLGAMTHAGQRGVLANPEVARVACSARLLALVAPHTSAEPRPVRAIYFNKSSAANWSVTWHQDVTVAVRQRMDVDGFGPWSIKDGVAHAHAPAEVLKQVLTIRLHLDDCDESNGPLRVLPGTHAFGRLSAEQIARLRAQISEIVCCARAGDALLMRPLLLHASAKSQGTGLRRILHIEYAGVPLPAGLQWNDRPSGIAVTHC